MRCYGQPTDICESVITPVMERWSEFVKKHVGDAEISDELPSENASEAAVKKKKKLPAAFEVPVVDFSKLAIASVGSSAA